MKTKIGILVLALCAPLTAEILNGSTRLSEVGVWGVFMGTLLPYAFLIVVLAYFTQRVASRTSLLFLLPIAGIVVEGLIVKSLFDTSFSDLSVLGGVGVWAGVQWPWTLSLVASHAFVSFIIPLTLAVFLAREVKISKALAYVSMSVLALFIGWTTIIIPHTFDGYWIKLAALVGIIALLVHLSRTVRVPSSSAPSAPLWVFFFAGLLFPPLNWLTSFFLETKSFAVILCVQAVFIGAYLYFLWAQWFNERTIESKHLAFIAGYYILFALGLVVVGMRRDVWDYRFVGACLTVGIVVLLMTAIRRSARG
ncbi:MAG: hypothetical protein A2481_00340 [Candidatus Yonathbacteria bacterium RIFOXYC2_FULL_47_9]|nr:MAG: hypothetical protein A2481_00340 [Candidatus Yonathbacteria bacterium RIFOXYC2_FULL_47_9]HAT68508.1 hypothetical protein [Candidatus Yonathbacteria bacterium]